jgi:hypothetical protein
MANFKKHCYHFRVAHLGALAVEPGLARSRETAGRALAEVAVPRAACNVNYIRGRFIKQTKILSRGPFLTSNRGKLTPRANVVPQGWILSPRGEVIPWGEILCTSLRSSKQKTCSPLGPGVKIPPRGQISPLGAKFTPRGEVHPWEPFIFVYFNEVIVHLALIFTYIISVLCS